MIAPEAPTHLTRATGAESALDFAIANLEEWDIGITAQPPSRRGGKGGMPDHGRVTVRVSKNPGIM